MRRAPLKALRELRAERDAFELERVAFERQREEEREALRRDRLAVEASREALEREKLWMAAAARAVAGAAAGPGDVFRLSVGGEKEVAVQRATLCAIEGSMLASQFSGRWDASLLRDDQGRVHIEASPELFCPLLEHLRQRALDVPGRPLTPLEVPLGREGDFRRLLHYWGLDGLLPPLVHRTPCRFLEIVSTPIIWHFMGSLSDAICVTTSRTVLLHGVVLAAGLHNCQDDASALGSYRGRLAVYHDGLLLHSQDVAYTVEGSSELEPVLLAPRPLIMEANALYEIEAKLRGPNAKYGWKGQKRVYAEDGVAFTFSNSESWPHNGTTVDFGQLPVLLYEVP